MRTYTTHPLGRRLIAAALAAVTIAGLAVSADTAAHADAQQAPAPPGDGPSGRTRLNSLEEAVAAGRLDAEVVSQLATNGSVDASVTVDQAAVLEETRHAVSKGKGSERATAESMRAGFSSRKSRVLGRHGKGSGATVITDYQYLGVTDMRITSSRALLDLVNDADVTGVRANRELQSGSMDPESAALVRQPAATASGYAGAGTYVAVLDTGLDYTRADFGSCTAVATPATCRVGAAFDAAPDDGWLDDDGHGTNVAGIVAGVAPGAKLIGIDVFQGKSASSPTMKAAIDYLIGQRSRGVNIVAFNMSIWNSTVATPNACADDLGFGAARAVGMIPVVIAGNGGSTSGVSYPGCISGALTVGAVYDSNVGPMSWSGCTDATSYADKVVCFSQSGPNLKMLAPGSVITAAGISQSGTSQAAPHVAGAVAVMAAAKPTAGIAGWEYALVNSGPWIVDRDGRSRHRLDLVAALNTLLGATDTTAPSVVAPSQTVLLNSTVGTTTSVVRISWGATDTSGIAAYDLYSSTNGGAWVRETLTSATQTSKDFVLSTGSTYQFTVAAKDGAGNWSGWYNGAAFKVYDLPENSTAISYSSGWTRTSWTSALGGFLTASATANASATFTFNGRSVAWVATKATNRGVAYVYIDGGYQGTVDLYSATTLARTVVLYWNWSTVGTHTVKVVVVGTTSRPTVDIDSFLVLG